MTNLKSSSSLGRPTRNRGVPLHRIMQRRGLPVSQKPLHNLRSSRANGARGWRSHGIQTWMGLQQFHGQSVRMSTLKTSNGPIWWQPGWQLLCRIWRYLAISDGHSKRKNPRKSCFSGGFTVCTVPHPRFERGLNDPESFVLPLHQRGVAEGQGPLQSRRMVNTRPALVVKD